ncbi:hypothetical protein LOTGIDRAFT_155866 [Lottia gigantea]|uniref:Uncharacterized protein n=1 Tax=Lottia gigantea TaxID=225164 RepID=V3ZPQ9_LOTGI|nr:hypothetical protein LOTGIDRAFT_155866 [Lottia gigantea]ESO82831.1 hypothetical protein LOTGIDRAFT_155866 [Lottia gigantea]
MGRTPKKKLLEKKCSSPDPRRLRSWRNNSASTSNPGSPKSRNDSEDLINKTAKIDAKYVDKLSLFDRPATRFQSKTKPTQEFSPRVNTKTNYVPEKQNTSLKKTLKSITDSTPSTSRLNPDHRRNQEFFIRRKRLRSDVDKDGLLEGLPIMLRYPKRSENCDTTILNVDLNRKNINEGLGRNQTKYVSETISKVGSRYRTRRCSLHSDDSQGFCTQTQPFAIEHSNNDENIETFEVTVSDKTNKSKSNVSQNISEAREKIKGKRKSASIQKNLQMKSLFKELFGSDSISDTSSSANESTSPKEDSKGLTDENSLLDKNLDNLPAKDSNKVQLENMSKTEMTTNHYDVSSSPPPLYQECTTSSSCTSCLNNCNCKIIETSKSEDSVNSSRQTLKTGNCSSITAESGSHTSIAIAPSISLDPVISQQDADDTSSVSAIFSTGDETSLSSSRGGLMRIFNPCISESRLYGEYSALSCIPGSEYSLHQSVSIHVSSSTTDNDISPASSVYPVNSADTTQMTSPQKTFGGKCSTHSCLSESVYPPKKVSTLSIQSDESKCDPIILDNKCVNRTTLTPNTDGCSIGGECSTQSLMPESVYSPRNESVSSLLSSIDGEEFHCLENPSNVCLRSSDQYAILDLDTCDTRVDITLTSIADGKILDGVCSRQNFLSETICSRRNESIITQQSTYYDDRVCEQTTFAADGKDNAIEVKKHDSLSESVSSSTLTNISLQSSDNNSNYDDDNINVDQTTLIPIADGRSRNGEFSEPGRLLKSDSAAWKTHILGSGSSVNSKDDNSVNDYPTNSAGITQYNSFNFEITEKRCSDISQVISRLTSSSSDTSSSGQSEVNYLGKKARIELFPEKMDSLPSIEDIENDSDGSNRLIIDLNEIFGDSVHKNQSIQSVGMTNLTLTQVELSESTSLEECLLESESFPDHQENTMVNEEGIKEEFFVTSGKEIATGDLNVLNTVYPEFPSDAKSKSSINTISLSGIKMEQEELKNTKELRSGSRPRRKKIHVIDTSKRKGCCSSSSNDFKETNKTKAKTNSKSESKCSHEKSKKSKSNKPDNSKPSVKKQSTPKKKEQCKIKSKVKPETPSKCKSNKTKTVSEKEKDESTSRSDTSKRKQPFLDEQPDKASTNLEIRKKSSKKKVKKESATYSVPVSDDNNMKQSLLKKTNLTSPSE